MNIRIKSMMAIIAVTAVLTACGDGGSNKDSTVAGLDKDSNSVRDDVDAYIAALTDTDPQKSALRQMSSSLRNAMLMGTTDQKAMKAASIAIGDAAACLSARYDTSVYNKKRLDIRKINLNTEIRVQAYEKFNMTMSATSYVLPQGDGCSS